MSKRSGEPMTLRRLRRMTAKGESDQLEFKKSSRDLKGGIESLCAFLNGAGGRVIFGVAADGAVIGQQVSDATLREIAAEIARIEPPAAVLQERVPVSATHEVLVLTATPTLEGPYVYKGRPYRRVGTTTTLMPQAEYQERLLQRAHPAQRWENQLAPGYRLKDLDANEIRTTTREAAHAGRLVAPVESPGEVLRKLHLLTGRGVVQAAVVAFGKEVLPAYPQCGLRLARFRGMKKDEFIDQQQVHGHAFYLLEEAMLFLRRHLPVAGRFEPGVMTRWDEPLFPMLALREAVVNALCHRDYSIAGGAVSIAIFDDRLEVVSTGGLPFGLTVADLKRDHSSKPRNPLLAEVFYRRGLIERWGRGTQRIIELCRGVGHPEPEFEDRTGEVIVRFLQARCPPLGPIGDVLTDRQRQILQVMCDGAKRQLRWIRQMVGSSLPATTFRQDLIKLKELRFLRSGGEGRGAYWQLEDEGASGPTGATAKKRKR